MLRDSSASEAADQMGCCSGALPGSTGSPNKRKSVRNTGSARLRSTTCPGKNATSPFCEPKNISPLELWAATTGVGEPIGQQTIRRVVVREGLGVRIEARQPVRGAEPQASVVFFQDADDRVRGKPGARVVGLERAVARIELAQPAERRGPDRPRAVDVNRVDAVVAARKRGAELGIEELEGARAWIETLNAFRQGRQPQRTAGVLRDRAVLDQTFRLRAEGREVLRRRLPAAQAEIRRDPQAAAAIDPQRRDPVVVQRSRIGRIVGVRRGPARTGIEANETVAVRAEPQLAGAVLRDRADTSREDRLVDLRDLIRRAVDPVQAAVRADPQRVGIFRVRCGHRAFAEALRGRLLVAVRPEARTLGVEAVDGPRLRRRPEAPVAIPEQADDEVVAQAVGVIGVALVPDRLLAVRRQLHEAELVGARARAPGRDPPGSTRRRRTRSAPARRCGTHRP